VTSARSPSISTELAYGEVPGIEAILDRESLTKVCRSIHDLFGLSVRLFSLSGSLLADVHTEASICRYVNTLEAGRPACAGVVSEVKSVDADREIVGHPCFTGAEYRVVPLRYQNRLIGRAIVGPFLPATRTQLPRSLVVLDPSIDKQLAAERLAELPRVREETVRRILEHLDKMLEMLVFSSHRARLTSEMHVASVRESHRELAQKSERLEEAVERLKHLDQLKSNFLATVSHELRTPLTSIIGYSEMLESGLAGDLTDEQQDFVRTIHQKGNQLLALISSLLDANRLERGLAALELEHVDVASVLFSVRETVRPAAEAKRIEVAAEVVDESCVVVGDPIRIEQLLSNLTDNAVKFTPHGGTVRVRARLTTMNDPISGFGAALLPPDRPAVQVTVDDSGGGIPLEERPKIFDAFYQVDGSTTRKHGGAGLGLSIVKSLVEAHGGTISVEGSDLGGARLAVILPVDGPLR
jgi:two-component system, NarL family, sensor histidine kinase BarA